QILLFCFRSCVGSSIVESCAPLLTFGPRPSSEGGGGFISALIGVDDMDEEHVMSLPISRAAVWSGSQLSLWPAGGTQNLAIPILVRLPKPNSETKKREYVKPKPN